MMFKRSSLFILLLFIMSSRSFAFSLGSWNPFFSPSHPKSVKSHTHRTAKSAKQPVRVKVGIYPLHIGQYDVQSSSTNIDFYLIFKCPTACKKLNFELMNAISADINLVAKEAAFLIYRIQAEVNKTDSLRNYPFDDHAIDIIIENHQLTSDEMKFEADTSMTALDESLGITDFAFSSRWTTKVTDRYDKTFQKNFSRYQFTMDITRPGLRGIIICILPAFVIIICSFLGLYLKIHYLSDRLEISTAGLIASVIFHFELTSVLPPLSYATYADIMMFINYFFLLVVLMVEILTTYLVENSSVEFPIKVEKICAWSIPPLWLIAQAINWVFYNPLR